MGLWCQCHQRVADDDDDDDDDDCLYGSRQEVPSIASSLLCLSGVSSVGFNAKSAHGRPLNEMFPSATVEALDFLRLCLQFNPVKRISAKVPLKD